MGRRHSRAPDSWPAARANLAEEAERAERTRGMVRDANEMLQQRTEEIEQERCADRRKRQRERKAACRRARDEADAEEERIRQEGNPDERVNSRNVQEASSRIAEFISEEFRLHCPGPRNRAAVMESLLENSVVHPNLPDYYRKPKDAKIMSNIVGSIRSQLQQVKGVHSSKKLAYKGALLGAIVGEGI